MSSRAIIHVLDPPRLNSPDRRQPTAPSREFSEAIQSNSTISSLSSIRGQYGSLTHSDAFGFPSQPARPSQAQPLPNRPPSPTPPPPPPPSFTAPGYPPEMLSVARSRSRVISTVQPRATVVYPIQQMYVQGYPPSQITSISHVPVGVAPLGQYSTAHAYLHHAYAPSVSANVPAYGPADGTMGYRAEVYVSPTHQWGMRPGWRGSWRGGWSGRMAGRIPRGRGRGLRQQRPQDTAASNTGELQWLREMYVEDKHNIRRKRRRRRESDTRWVEAGRGINYWTEVEVKKLREQVQLHGKRWAHILSCNKDFFQGRTPGNLKDKWRNLTDRSSAVTRLHIENHRMEQRRQEQDKAEKIKNSSQQEKEQTEQARKDEVEQTEQPRKDLGEKKNLGPREGFEHHGPREECEKQDRTEPELSGKTEANIVERGERKVGNEGGERMQGQVKDRGQRRKKRKKKKKKNSGREREEMKSSSEEEGSRGSQRSWRSGSGSSEHSRSWQPMMILGIEQMF